MRIREKPRNYLFALQLSFFCGMLGFDRFYLGKITSGFFKVITFGGLGIWWLVDVFNLLYGYTTDVDGYELEGGDRRDPIMLFILSLNNFDQFYLHETALGILKIISFGGFGIWTLVDIIRTLKGRRTDKLGMPIELEEKKNLSVALFYSIFFGRFGLDRFYLGYHDLGMLKLFTFGALGLWSVVDIILLITNGLSDANGNKILAA
ncbi:MAG: NINE protein [Promethearchaeota archaeon]